MQFTSKKCMLTCLGLGLISLGLILATYWMTIFNNILAKVCKNWYIFFHVSGFYFDFYFKELALAPNSRSFDLWKNPPLKLNFDIYLFNWTNPCNLTADDYEKPILKQIGPYRFREIPTKTKIRWHKNSTISYRRKSTYFFVEEESAGRLDDTIVTINAVAVVSGSWSILLHILWSLFANWFNLFKCSQQRTLHDFGALLCKSKYQWVFHCTVINRIL